MTQKMTRGLLLAALAGFALLAYAQPAAAAESDPVDQQLGFTGRYLVIYEERRNRPFRIKTFDPLTLKKKVVYTAPRKSDLAGDLVAANGRISFYRFSERRIRHRGRVHGIANDTLVTMNEEGGDRQIVTTFRRASTGRRECGSLSGSMILADNGAHYVVEHVVGKIAANGVTCAKGSASRAVSQRLLRFDNPTATPVSRMLKSGTEIPSNSYFYGSTAPDGSGYAFQNRSSIAYYDMATGAKRVISPDRGLDFEEFRLGPGRRMIASAREHSGKMNLHVYFFPDIHNPTQRIELTGISSDELFGRFCGERPLVIDESKRRYVLFDQLGRELQDVYTGVVGTRTISVGCTTTNLVLAVERPEKRNSRRWVFAPLVP